MASPTQWTWVWASSRSWWWTGKPGNAAVHGVSKSQTWLRDWAELNPTLRMFIIKMSTKKFWRGHRLKGTLLYCFANVHSFTHYEVQYRSSLKIKWSYLQNRNTLTDAETEKTNLSSPKWKSGGREWISFRLTYTHYYIQNIWSIRTYCIAQGTLFKTLYILYEQRIWKKRRTCI